ncbi:telomere-associated protein Tap [Streptomyces sp. MI02-7b]|uniref:telomere-associated protein Tap n=1 Tax=Streptomyces sp. MI02-7b TaxID=462941 RepID=UPI0029A02895|nr:helix-turn-helix transcriptional regulator [Streptomyces sp. MI02-7b]MDX3072782.1 helix-turn-helix transcriptional regulator [Streptomyces sp. MI02-7b]
MAAAAPDPVDALLRSGPRRTRLPEPAERSRLRTAYGLTQAEIAEALQVTRTTVAGWEAGRSEPQGATRAAYAKLLEGIAGQLAAGAPPSPTAPAAENPSARPGQAASDPSAVPVPVTAARAAGAAPLAAQPSGDAPRGDARRGGEPPAARTPHAGRRSTGQRDVPRPEGDHGAPDPRFVNGPLAVLDGDGSAYGAGGLVLECPAADVPSLVEWTLTEARLGAPRLHRNGKDADPLVVLTASAAERLGLPAELEDRRGLRLPPDHPVVRRITRAGWQLTQRGFGPWARVFRPAEGGRRQCVQLAVLPWGALDARSWGGAAGLPAPELARTLAAYASRVLTPRGSTAVSGLELMTALRPPTRPVKDPATGAWVSGPNPGALTGPVDPAPPEAPDEHPVVAALHPRGHLRTPDQVLDEEAYDWIRDPELLTDTECAQPYAVGVDVNMAFAAAANRLTVGLGEPVHVKAPAFDKALPGCWLVDLSGIDLDPRLPSPFTPHGGRPEGPAWYATPTVAYAVELGHAVAPLEAYVRPEHGPYLDAWYTRLRDAYLATMGELGVVPGMPEDEFLAAMERHKRTDPARVALLSAIKATVKGGIGKLRERPQGAGYRPGERWPALERPTWRPDIRAAVIATARVNMHRKMLRLAAVGLHPIAVLSDCAVYLSDGPGPPDFLPYTPDGKPLPGGFRLGVSPGMVKHEGTQTLMWAAELLEDGHNPARHIKGTDAAADGE